MCIELRHRPEVISITLYANAWVGASELIEKINAHGVQLDMPTLLQVVEQNNRRRFSLKGDLTKIRANQGA